MVIISFCLSCCKNKVIEVREDPWVITWLYFSTPDCSQSLNFLTAQLFSQTHNYEPLSKMNYQSSLQNANESQWELHLSLVAALLSCFDCKLRTTKSWTWSARHTHLVSHTPSLCPSPGHVHPLSPAVGVGPCRQRRALDLRAALLEAADGPKLLCPSSVPRETAGSTWQHHLTTPA